MWFGRRGRGISLPARGGMPRDGSPHGTGRCGLRCGCTTYFAFMHAIGFVGCSCVHLFLAMPHHAPRSTDATHTPHPQRGPHLRARPPPAVRVGPRAVRGARTERARPQPAQQSADVQYGQGVGLGVSRGHRDRPRPRPAKEPKQRVPAAGRRRSPGSDTPRYAQSTSPVAAAAVNVLTAVCTVRPYL